MRKECKILLITIFFWILVLMFSNVKAASASISASSTSVTVGKSVKITVKVNAQTWHLSLKGGLNKLINDGSLSGNISKTYTYTFTPKEPGKYTITLSGDMMDEKDDPTDPKNEIKVNKPITITAKKASSSGGSSGSSSSKSSDATLKMLGVNPSKYDFSGFSKNKTTYNVKVPSSVNSLSVYATTSSSKAKYSVSGNTNLKGGTNLIKVTVTAEDGTKKTYTIRVTKEVDEEEVTPNKIDEEDENEGKEENQENGGIGLSSLEISGYELNQEFNTNIYNYYVVIGNVKFSSIDELKELVKSAVNFEGAKTEIKVNEGSEDDEFVYEVLITVLDDEKEYATYSIRFVESAEDIPGANEEVIYPEDKEAEARLEEKNKGLPFDLDKEKVEKGILIGSIALPVLIAIVLGAIAYDKSKKLRRYEEKYNDDFDDDFDDNYNNDNTAEVEKTEDSTENQNDSDNEESNTEYNNYNEDIDRSKYEPRYRNPRGGDRRGGRHF